MAFGSVKSFGELNSSLVSWRLAAILLIISNLLTALMLFGAHDNRVPVMITKDGQAIELNMSWDDWKSEARKPEAKGFARNMFTLILKQDYRTYESNITMAQEQMTPSLRSSMLNSIKAKNVFKELRTNQVQSAVEIVEESLEATQQKDGFDVALQAIVQTQGVRDIPRRERIHLVSHLKNTYRSTLHPNGFLLDSFQIKERVAEPYEDSKKEEEQKNEEEAQIVP
jgi:hypothetical protein